MTNLLGSISLEAMTWLSARQLTKREYAKMTMCLTMGNDPTQQEGYETIKSLFTLNNAKEMTPAMQEAFIRLAAKKLDES